MGSFLTCSTIKFMNSNSYTHFQVATYDQLLLNGLLLPGSPEKTACIFIHGFTTDFYSHVFYHTMAKALSDNGHAFILAQNRGTGVQTEVMRVGKPTVFLGSYFEKLEDAHLDISAFIELLQTQGYKKFCLIGHSLGTIKVVRYLSEGKHADSIEKIILLSPFDKNAYMERKMPGMLQSYVSRAKQEVANGNSEAQVPIPEFEDYAISYETYVSWYADSELNNMWDFYRERNAYSFPALQKIAVPTRVVLGENDQFMLFPEFGVSPQSALACIEKHVPNCKTKLIPNCNHIFSGFEDQLAAIVQRFVND